MNIDTDPTLRSRLGESPREIQTNFIDRENPLDNELGYLYSGKVVDNNDPDKEGKCKIRVYGVFDESIPDNDLPWALPDFGFIGSKVGSFIVPPIDAIVKVYFDRGDIYLPHYTTKAVNSQPSEKDTNYPNNMIFYETDDGDSFSINRSTKETKFKHSSGTQITIDINGNVTVNLKIASTLNFDSNMTVVTPDATSFGPFCAIQFDTLTGLPLQGNIVTKVS